MNYRTRWKKATKRAYREARRLGKPMTLQEASILGQMWLTLMGIYPTQGTGFFR